jgi:prevent-host-death family protein
MASVGVRELRQRASELLRRVQAGESIQVTDRGRPVAILSPIVDGSPLEVLRAEGQVENALIGIDELPAPLQLDASQAAPSSVLKRLRSHER